MNIYQLKNAGVFKEKLRQILFSLVLLKIFITQLSVDSWIIIIILGAIASVPFGK